MASVDIRVLSRRMTELRTQLLRDYPFYGRLLLHLQVGYAACGTAYTDMKHIVFDPEFASALPDKELKFVLLHEVMHCVLCHCTRGKNLRPRLYNIACDIVVNSLILETIGQEDFQVYEEPVLHLTPIGTEGREHSAEQVYEMLLHTPEEESQRGYGVNGFDIHDVWDGLSSPALADAWGQYVREAAAAMGEGSGIPYGIQRHLGDIYHRPKVDWRQLLSDFIRHDRCDFTYQIPDHRFSGDFIIPSFQDNLYGERVDRLWFLVDTSGSISGEKLTDAYIEIRGAVEQIDTLSGELSFFDAKVTDPVPFETVEDLRGIKPMGGGGTSFDAIFRYLGESFEEKPRAIIILTDGYARFPEERATLDVPVLWLILGSEVKPPWGECIHL